MNLNDLGRAAYEAANAAQAQFYSRHAWVAWELLDSNDKRANGLSALAAVERFAEEADKLIDRVARACIMASLSHGNSEVRIAMDKTANMIQDELKTLLSSLRDEANTIAAKQQKGS